MNFSRLANSLLLGCVLTAPIFSTHAAVLYKDDFEVGSLKYVLSAAKWLESDSANVTVSNAVVKSGRYAAKFHFAGNASLSADADAWAELRFDLGKVTNELWVKYDLYIPANYVHRKAASSNNNKFIRLWGGSYADKEKVGLSLWPNGTSSSLQADWDLGGGVGPDGQVVSSFIGASDLGKWMEVKIYVKAATASAAGTMKVWKNGALVINNTGLMKNYYANETHGYRYGYLLGWSNSGFTQDTDLYIDNVIFGTLEADVGGAAAVTSAPQAPVLRVN